MSEHPRTRQEIYDRIRETSSEQVQLEDMVRLGFWPRRRGRPEDPVDEVRRRGELLRRLKALQSDHRRLGDQQAALREVRRRRMKAAKERRVETKARRIREREEKARAWSRRKQSEILFLGEEVSGGLGKFSCDIPKLQKQGLPIFESMEELAGAMGITVPELRFLAFDRKVSSQSHYVQFTVPKKTGGERLISAPMPRLKRAQRWVLDTLLTPIDVHDAAHGFREGRSIVTNATPHVGADVVVNVDLSDFFPTVGYRRVRGVFKGLGYSEAISTVLALVCTEPQTTTVELDGRTWYVKTGTRLLPQGAPTSPAITNLICRKLDRRLHGLARRYGFTYTRYADDLTFSAPKEAGGDVGIVLRCLRQVVAAEGFVVHPEKTRILRNGARKEVTGVVVNEKLSVDRKTLRKFRAVLFQIYKDGPEGKSWGAEGAPLFASLQGYADFVYMVDPQRGGPLREKVLELRHRHGVSPAPRPAAAQPAATQAAAPAAPTAPSAPPAESGDLNDLIRQFSGDEEKPAEQSSESSSESEEDKDKKWWKLF
ncbi:MAG: reverse transcriptase family protein [Bradymonadia bacterium]